MAERSASQPQRLAASRDKMVALSRSRRLRKITVVLFALILLFGLFGFLAAPSLFKSQLQARLGAMLHRPVTVEAVHFNPFTLKLELDHLHIGDRDGITSFVDVDALTINASWSSLFRLAPVLDALTVTHPQLHIVRTAPQQFNFSDLIEQFAGKPAAPGDKPARFSLSNISLHDGDILLDDKVQGTTHHVDRLELGLPFIANLPHDTDVFVKPLLAMRVDGSAMHVEGQTKPFADSLESVMSFALDHLDLSRYLAYSPVPLPVVIPRGQLSGQFDLHFISTKPSPQLRLGGKLQLDNFAMTARNGAPIVELGHADVALDDVEPLLSRYRIGAMQLNQLALHYARLAGGHSSIDALMPETPTPKSSEPSAHPTDMRIAVLTLQDARVDYADQSGPKPASLALDHLHGSVRGLSTLAAPASIIDLTTQLAGGTVTLGGKLDMAASRYVGPVNIKGVSIAPLLALAPPMLDAEMTSGNVDANVALQAHWGKTFNVQVAPTTITVNNLALVRRGRTPVAWQTLGVNIASVDLATSTAQIDSVSLHGMKLDAQRSREGRIDLTELMAKSPSTSPARRGNARHPATTSPAWHWNIHHFNVDASTIAFKDMSAAGKPASFTIKADKFSVDGLSDNMRLPLKIDLGGGIGRGSYRVIGTLKPQPLDADVRINTTRLDVASLQSLITVPLNVRISSALVSVNGRVQYRDHKPAALISYHGQLTLGRVRVQDKLSDNDFLRWNALTARGLDVRVGENTPKVSIAGLSLDDFYARVIVNANGRLNLQDVVSNPSTAPVSVTAVQTPAVAASVAQANAAAATSSATPAADVQIGRVALARGQLNYTDNFIKPNYTANITQLNGTIGAFGTKAGGPPAELTLQGKLDDDAPVDIGGTINPLAPVAFLDVKAKADGVELTHLSPYSGKYAGYPITKGRLTMDVHYLLDQGKLTADNHIFIDQLTFGDRIDGPGISHLPVKLAVALLKDAQGRIDVHVPVSGSLSDPHFSVGGLIWHAFVNLIGRAITSPFRLLASAMGGHQQDLGYVEFAPGSSGIDAQAQSRLGGIVKILNEKPSLKLDVTGRVDRKVDEAGLRKVTVDDLIQAEASDHADDDAPKGKLSADDVDKNLKRAYKHAKFKKERDLIGLTKSQPPEVMRKMLEENVAVDDDAMRHLAERRASAVRQWLHGKVDDKRLFELAPKLDSKSIDDNGKTTRVDFGLH
ncbi:DUF748 domain-containing protein [Rhodanobacter sp. L36]|uniref:DUF748 domain-containing protein n=1 Tax=Rhodanobacter sp. L36 TaxID=1747221 RepID=UPI00131C48C8|nr:DUF748 domain-containing protein [Rhodanobacter sp. L36]